MFRDKETEVETHKRAFFLGNHVQGTNKTQRFFNPFTCGNVNLKRKEEFILDYIQKYSTRPDLQYSFQHGFHVTFDLILFDSTLVLRIVFVVGSVSMDFWRGEMSKQFQNDYFQESSLYQIWFSDFLWCEGCCDRNSDICFNSHHCCFHNWEVSFIIWIYMM